MILDFENAIHHVARSDRIKLLRIPREVLKHSVRLIDDHNVALHEGRNSTSGGVSYVWRGTHFSVDEIFGTGLRQDLVLANGDAIPNGDHTPSYLQVNLGMSHDFGAPGWLFRA